MKGENINPVLLRQKSERIQKYSYQNYPNCRLDLKSLLKMSVMHNKLVVVTLLTVMLSLNNQIIMMYTMSSIVVLVVLSYLKSPLRSMMKRLGY